MQTNSSSVVPPASVSTFAAVPQVGFFLRLSQIIGDPKANPPKTPLLPLSRSSWWAGIKSGRYPKGIKLSPRVTVWRASDIMQLIADLSEGAQ